MTRQICSEINWFGNLALRIMVSIWQANFKVQSLHFVMPAFEFDLPGEPSEATVGRLGQILQKVMKLSFDGH